MKKVSSGKGGALLLSGKYLYAVLNDKLCTFDVSNPLSPVKLSAVPAAGNRQLAISGTHLFLSCRVRGVQVFSLEDPAAPRAVNHFFPIELATGLTISGNILAVTLRIYGVEFFDISNPEKVEYLGLLHAGEAQSATFFGNKKIVVGDWGGGNAIIADVSDPSRPRKISAARLDSRGDGTFVKGNYLYCATGGDSRKSGKKGAGHGLEIFDISNLKRPRRTGMVKFIEKVTHVPDWWSVIVVNETAFVADTQNGVFVVDVKDKRRPVVVSNVKIPGDSASQIAVGDKVVYVSGHLSGLYLFKNDAASVVIPGKSVAVTRPEKLAPPPEVPGLRHIRVPGFVWSIAKYGSKLYAACGDEGLKEFTFAPDGSLLPGRCFPVKAMDCDVSEKLLVVAADTGLKIFDRTSGKLINSTAAPWGAPFLQLRLYGDLLCTNSRGGRLSFRDISDPARPRLIGNAAGGGLLYSDMLPERTVNGKFPVNWHSRFVRWYDLNGKEFAGIPKLHRRSSQRNGITEVNGKFLLIGRNTAFMLSPETPDKFIVVPMQPGKSGIPSSDGNIIAVSNRQQGEVYFYRFDGKTMTGIKERRIAIPSAATGRVVFHNGKAYIPAGRYGIYFE